MAEFLEFEVYFELARYLQIEMRLLKSYKCRYPDQFATALVYVLDNVVSSNCRDHVESKLAQRREAKQS